MTFKWTLLLLFQKVTFKELILDIPDSCGNFWKEIYHNLFITIKRNLCAYDSSWPAILCNTENLIAEK